MLPSSSMTTRISAVVLTGRADKFSFGVDLKTPENARVAAAGLSERRARSRVGPRMCEAWERLEPMTITAIEGFCVGGGAALAVSLDLRVMAEDATLYVPEVERGMNMSWGSVPRFVNLCGPARTKRIVVLAEQLGAARCEQWGLADEVCPNGTAVRQATRISGITDRVRELPRYRVEASRRGRHGGGVER